MRPSGSCSLKPDSGLPSALGGTRSPLARSKYSAAVMTMKRPRSECISSVAAPEGGPVRRNRWKCSKLSALQEVGGRNSQVIQQCIVDGAMHPALININKR